MSPEDEATLTRMRRDVVGYGSTFSGAYGDKLMVYADWTASGRALRVGRVGAVERPLGRTLARAAAPVMQRLAAPGVVGLVGGDAELEQQVHRPLVVAHHEQDETLRAVPGGIRCAAWLKICCGDCCGSTAMTASATTTTTTTTRATPATCSNTRSDKHRHGHTCAHDTHRHTRGAAAAVSSEAPAAPPHVVVRPAHWCDCASQHVSAASAAPHGQMV